MSNATLKPTESFAHLGESAPNTRANLSQILVPCRIPDDRFSSVNASTSRATLMARRSRARAKSNSSREQKTPQSSTSEADNNHNKFDNSLERISQKPSHNKARARDVRERESRILDHTNSNPLPGRPNSLLEQANKFALRETCDSPENRHKVL